MISVKKKSNVLQTVVGKHVSRVHVFHNIVNILFSPDTWYVLTSGSDKEGCGRTPGSACSTLLYLLQQVNRTHLSPSTGIQISTDKSLTIDQQAAVSTNLFV